MIRSKQLATATAHLSKNDPKLSTIIKVIGPCTITPHANYYQELVEAIISQQLSIKAAATILKRFVELFNGTFPTPKMILEKDTDQLRSVGLSRAKASYVQDLAKHILDNKLQITKLPELNNQKIITELTAVKGIGEWTAHMFLIFALGRLDILPTGDLGFRAGIQRLYNLKDLPTVAQIHDLAIKNNWHPFESIACWYIWQSLDKLPKSVKE